MRPAHDTTPLVLFGGTFDPVHRAHISAARSVSRVLGEAPVHLLPNSVPPHRPQPLANGEQRLAMLKLACKGHPQLIPDDWELKQSGPSYSLLTLHSVTWPWCPARTARWRTTGSRPLSRKQTRTVWQDKPLA